MNDPEALEFLAKHAAALAERFDHVQILVTWDEEGVTKSRHCGRGNWFARVGLAQNFCDRNKANDAADLMAEKINPQDEE